MIEYGGRKHARHRKALVFDNCLKAQMLVKVLCVIAKWNPMQELKFLFSLVQAIVKVTEGVDRIFAVVSFDLRWTILFKLEINKAIAALSLKDCVLSWSFMLIVPWA